MMSSCFRRWVTPSALQPWRPWLVACRQSFPIIVACQSLRLNGAYPQCSHELLWNDWKPIRLTGDCWKRIVSWQGNSHRGTRLPNIVLQSADCSRVCSPEISLYDGDHHPDRSIPASCDKWCG